MKLRTFGIAVLMSFGTLFSTHADPLKVAYSDWPGWTLLEVAKQKDWFKEAGVEVELQWFDYGPSMDAFSAGKVDAVTIVATDAMVLGSNGAKSKIIMAIDYSDGNDKIIGKPGIKTLKELKGQKVALEATLVDHLLLLKGLEMNGMKASDVTIVPTATNETPQSLASGQVGAIGAWYPVAGQALKQVAGATPLFTSADAKGLIYDVVAVSPVSFGQRKEDWTKFVKVYYRCIDYLLDPKTKDDAIKIMAAKVGAKTEEFAENVPGTHLLPLKEGKKVMTKGPGLDSLYGSMTYGNKFNLDNGVYKESQKPESYIAPSITTGMK